MKREYTTKMGTILQNYVSQKREESFTAQEVYQQLVKDGIEVNITTIYRNLEKLVQKNVIVQFKSQNCAYSCYRVVDQSGTCHRHLHLQCKKCGKIYHLSGEMMEKISGYVRNEFNFDLDCPGSILTGVCEACKKNEATNKE